AGDAEPIGAVGLDQPIAHAEIGIGAEAIELALGGARAPGVALGLERGQNFGARKVAQTAPAFLAFGVFEIEQLSAELASEKFHVTGRRVAYHDLLTRFRCRDNNEMAIKKVSRPKPGDLLDRPLEAG